ncbi:hypothetical protein P3T76_010591 [Phytophthora citrophthora]|uniref:Uncharacterized protein n=1 Tax=Phytophthora citrophthora TaxID=4793 RepID=A0AAD9GBE5_9STRA|nr:hypothetical protein P3T76_010591 [Phytophthora citrophthora]
MHQMLANALEAGRQAAKNDVVEEDRKHDVGHFVLSTTESYRVRIMMGRRGEEDLTENLQRMRREHRSAMKLGENADATSADATSAAT